MSHIAQNSTEELQLEQLIDKHGVHRVLQALSNICYAKAQHLEENWQDRGQAKMWDRVGKTLDKCSVLSGVVDLHWLLFRSKG